MKSSLMMKILLATLCFVMVPDSAFAQFAYKPAGELKAGSGKGRKDSKVYVPGMRFPLESSPAYANSQVWGKGGMNGGGGGQCDAPNYSYPWYDNFCETRSWGVPLCPSGKGHQGQDIRPATCTKNKHYVVAAEAGTVTSIATYSVNIQSGGTLHRYMHMNHGNLLVKKGSVVKRGQRLGLVSNNMGSTPTTIHLHYDLRQTVSGVGSVHVPTYMSLIRSYEALLGTPAVPCAKVPAAGGVVDNEQSCFELKGNVTTWRNVTTAGNGGSLRWTYVYDGAKPDGIARWNLDMTGAGTYKVEAHIVAEHGKTKKARYTVRHKGAQKEVILDQSAAAGWRSLGEFDFAAGNDQWVELYDNSGEPLSAKLPLMADAIRLSVPDPVVEPDQDTGIDSDVGTDLDEDAGGDSDTGGGSEEPGNEEPGNDVDPDFDPDYDPTLDPENNDVVLEGTDGKTKTASASSCSAVSVGSTSGGSGLLLGLIGLAGVVGVVRRRTSVKR